MTTDHGDSVVNPNIRLSHIMTRWDPEQQTRAQEVIAQTVSIFVVVSMLRSHRYLQMQTYRTQLDTTTRPEDQVAIDDRSQDAPPRRPRKLQSLAERYGITVDDTVDTNSTGTTPSVSIESELHTYLGVQIANKTDPITFWQMSQTLYPTLFRISMDYLPIQASSVPSERIFSSSAETTTKRRNRISPALMEALQMAKFFLKKRRLNFTEHLLVSEADMALDHGDGDEGDLLGRLLGDEPSDDLMDRIMVLIAQQEGDELQ